MVYPNYTRISKGNGISIFLTVVILSIICVGGFLYIINPTTPDVTSPTQTITYSLSDNTNPTNTNPLINPNLKINSTQSNNAIQIDSIALEHNLHSMINNMRIQNGINPLIYDDKLATISRDHSKDMAINNYYDHTSPNGIGLPDRYRNANYLCFNWMGENIQQQNINNIDLTNTAFQTWIDSPEHKNNILDTNFMKEGIGVYVYFDTVFITEDFC